jgi:phosphoglycolate phosphatase
MRTYFFDLDGVLADARPGLFLSFRAALKAIKLPNLPDSELERFLGTPLPEMFRVLKPNITSPEIAVGIQAFRAIYETSGIQQNRLYPGACELLRAIATRNGAAWIVTSKPEHHAQQVAELLGLRQYVRGIVGAGLDETDTKAGLIARALSQAAVESDNVIMLGDRHYDISGALTNKVLPVGSLWGYGSYAELYDAGCRNFVRSPSEFQTTFVENEHVATPEARRRTA